MIMNLECFRRIGGHRGREVGYLKESVKIDQLLEKVSETSEKCPYCAENNADFKVIYEFSKPEQPWWVRVVKDPYLDLSLIPEKIEKGYFDGTPFCEETAAYGQAEIIIEERKCGSYYKIPLKQMREILYMYHQRYKVLAVERCVYQVLLFKKYIPGRHNITHIIGQSVLSHRISRELGIALEYSHSHAERCLYCDFLKPTITQKMAAEFQIEETNFFKVICLRSERNPFGVQIIPRRHQSDFSEINLTEIEDLVGVWYRLFQRFFKLFGDIGFEFCLDSAPVNKNFPDYHWHFDISPIFPNTFYQAYQPHIYINPVKPEDAARILREVKLD